MNTATFNKRRAKIERQARARSKQFQRKAMGHLMREARATAVVVRGKLVAWELGNGATVCDKYRYTRRGTANGELVHLHRVYGAKAHPVRVYFCPHCKGFHLTSQQPFYSPSV